MEEFATMSSHTGRPNIFPGLETAHVSVVVPVFNEGEKLAENLDLLIEEIEPYFEKYEIIVISDGSKDNTNQVLASFHGAHDEMGKKGGANIRKLPFTQNQGKGAVIRRGFEEAKGDFIFFIDGGMELHPKELRAFLGLMFLYDAHIVIGSKRHPQSHVDYPWYRKALSFLYQKLIHQLFDVDVTDTQVGMKLFRREAVQAILPHLEINRYGFDLEILSLAKLKGFGTMLEAPIRLDYYGRTDRAAILDMWRVVKMGFSLLRETLQLYRKLQKLKKSPPPQ